MIHSTLFGLTLAAGCLFVLATVASAQLPTNQFPDNCAVQLKGHNYDNATLKQVHDLGFRGVRKGLYWNSVEKEKGVYDFSTWDPFFKNAKDNGLWVIGCLFGGNKLYEDDGQGGIQTEAGRKGFAAFAAAMAKRYKDYDVVWEIWNEPNVRTFWRKNGMHNTEPFADEYTGLVKACGAAMLKADPGCVIAAGSVSNYWKPSYQWTEFCFQKGILKSGIKVWSVHPYGVKTPEEFSVGHKITRDLLKKYGAPDMVMANTERGFAVKKPKTQLELEGWSGGKERQLREYQAWHFVRQFMMDQINGLNHTSWYELDGDAFGIADEGGSRPIYPACKTMLAQLDGYHFVKRLDTKNDLDYAVLFENGKGGSKLVTWTAPPPGASPDDTADHVMQFTISGDVSAIDLKGKPIKLETSGSTHSLMLTGSPVYLAIPANAKVSLKALPPVKKATAEIAPPPAGAVDLGMLASDDTWKFVKNTGQGSFTVGTDGDKAIGTMQYDFTKSKSKGTPYILAVGTTNIPQGATEVRISARSSLNQPLTFRLNDSTGQTLQFKKRIKGTGSWELITIPLTRKLEHWGGANDGKPHFPVTSISLSLPQPNDGTKTGKVEYADIIAVMPGGSAATTTSAPAAKLAGNTDLKLFADASSWKFQKNTGDGSFTVSTDGDTAVGVMNYDFTKSTTSNIPYVLATAEVNVPAGATAIQLKARGSVAQKLTFRVKDSTGQTLQFKGKIKGTGSWETITIPLTRKLEHWGGANDGRPHFPLTSVTVSVPRPSEEVKTGKVEYSELTAIAGG